MGCFLTSVGLPIWRHVSQQLQVWQSRARERDPNSGIYHVARGLLLYPV